MLDRGRVRCPVCKSTVPLAVLWAAGDTCPRCASRVDTARRRAAPAGVAGKALALLAAESVSNPIRSELAKR